MAITNIPTRTTADPNASSDVNTLNDNDQDLDGRLTTNTANIASLGVSSVSKAANYTILDNDTYNLIYVTATSTITLPTLADNQDRIITIFKNFATAGLVTIDGEGAETINSQATIPLVSDGDYIKIVAESGSWKVLNHDINYSTGWINRSDWLNVHMGTVTTKNTDSNLSHNMDAEYRDITISTFVSTDGTEDNSFYVSEGVDNAAADSGLTSYQVDSNDLIVQTGTGGIGYVSSSGSAITLSTDDWYYLIAVKRNRIQ